VEIRLFKKDGTLADTITDTIEPDGNLPVTPGSEPFEQIADGGWMDIVSESGVKLSGYQYIQTVTSQKNEIDTLAALPVFSNVQYVPHIPSPDNWLTELTLINPNNRENQIVFHFSRAGNDNGENQTMTLGPYEKRTVDLGSEFAKPPGDPLYLSVLEVRGEYAFVGYYAYSSTASLKGDKAGFPLLDNLSLKNELILPHVPAAMDQWWTGVAVCNPGDDVVDVVAEPYGADGELIENLVKIVLLDPGAYEVFEVRSFFDGTDADIAFVKFRMGDDLNSVIGGFYLYGNKVNGKGSVESLSGANM